MSYRNPTQYIDRQSGQIEQNLQKTLAGIGTGIVSSINKIHADNTAKTAAIRAEADKRVADAQNSIMQTQSKNPTADFGDLDTQLEVMNGILLKDPAKRTAEEKTFVNSMETIGDNMANMLKNTAMSQEAMMEQVNKIPGTMGAIDPKANPEQYAKLSVLANQTEGKTKARYKVNKNGQIVFSLDVYQKTKDGEKFVGSVINDNVATTQMPTVIPNISKDIDQNIQNTINLVDPTSELSPVLNNDKSEILYHQDKFGRRVNPEDFKNKLRVQSESTLSQFSDRKLASLYNNVLNPGDTDFSYDTPLSDDQKNKAKEALLNYMMKQPAVTKVLGNIVESKIPTKKGSTYKPSELEKMAAKVDKQFKVLQKWDGKGNPTPSIIPSAIVKGVQAKWDANNKVWAIQQKSANKWENLSFIKNATDFEKLALELGYDVQEVSKEDKKSALDKWENRADNINKSNEEGTIPITDEELAELEVLDNQIK